MNIKNLFAITASFGLILISASTNYAQSVNQEEPNPFQSNEQNPMYGDGIDPMKLIHNMNLSTGRSGDEFIEDTNDNLDKAAEQFRKEQLLRIQQQEESISSPDTTDINN
jgi:hypothetical protein